MSLRRNILANYTSQIYVTLIGILMLPVYLRYMGAEAYGLVGFFTMLNAWFQLLDMGLTPTLARETARYRGGALDAATLRGLLRALEGIFFGVAILAATAFLFLSDWIAGAWLSVAELDLGEVARAVMLMGFIIPLRWISGLYRGAVNGFERQVWLAGFNMLVATARFVGVLAVFELVGTRPTHFFAYQLGVAVIEVLLIALMTHRLLPARPTQGPRRASWGALRGVVGFSATIAFTAGVWVLITQTDKLVLSKLLPLAEYGYFTLAVLVAGAINLIGAPVAQALMPRMARLAAEGDEAGMLSLYRRTTQLVCLLAVPAALTLTAFAEPILWAWTGDRHATDKAALVLSLYAIGNGLLAVSAFPYYLQYAKGDLRLHLIGNALMLLILIPALIWATTRYGAVGAGTAWTSVTALYFLLWVPLVHRRMHKGLHAGWLGRDVAPIVGVTATMAWAMAQILQWPEGRVASAGLAVAVGLILLLSAAAASSEVRSRVSTRLRPARVETCPRQG